MEKILFLVHRIPYPPNKGDKIRSFNILKWLASRYEVHLACFIDDVEDFKYESELAVYCKSYKVVGLNPMKSKIRSLTGLFTNKPLTLPYYYASEMDSWVSSTVSGHSIDKCVVFSSSMVQYVEKPDYAHMHKVIDLVDVDSDKWRQYAEKSSFPMNWVYSREHKTLESYEKAVTQKMNAIALVSDDEATLFRKLVGPALSNKVHALLNGVDSDFFDPSLDIDKENLPEHFISFTGAMDYWANIEAVLWFVKEVWPTVLERHPDTKFYVVGTNPSSDILSLDGKNNVVVTGRVHDVRSYIREASLVVAPLRIARGVQNKVLEALAMKKYIIGTSMAFEGIDHSGCDLDIAIVDQKEAYSEKVIEVLEKQKKQELQLHFDRNRDFVIDSYNWNAKLNKLNELLG